MAFFNLRDGKGCGDGNLTYTAIPLGLLGLPRSSLRGRRLKRKGKGVLGANARRCHAG